MKINLKISLLILFIFLISLISCRRVNYTKSDAIIVNRTFDSSLGDSALIYGMVYYAADEKTPYENANIWIANSNIKTTSDNTGFFSLKIIPGLYTIKCLGQYSSQEFTMVIKDLSISSNEKIEIRFLHGDRSE